MKKVCVASRKEFEITEADLKFYEKMGVPTPKLCPHERQRRRQAFRNERFLYHRICDATGKKIISIYSQDSPFKKVVSPDFYWGDNWEAKDYGRDFDFNRSFFEQFLELYHKVPQLSLIRKETENSDFAHDAIRLKNCYLTFDGEQARDCMYGETFYMIQDCLDFLFLRHSELCYECVNCENGYHLFFSYNSKNCSDSWFLRDCIGCRNCFGCSNLIKKEYYIYNKPHTKEEYEQFISGFHSGKHSYINKLKANAVDLWETQFVKHMAGTQNENVTGDHVSNSKDCTYCFDAENIRDCKYVFSMQGGGSDCHDINIWGVSTELCYNCSVIGEGARNIIASFYIAFGCENVSHSAFCWQNSKNLVGCVGMSHAENCILNKQYSDQEYQDLREKVKAYMIQTGEWGEFFPTEISPFAYNETPAQEYYPLTESECLAKRWKWKKEDKIPQAQTYEIPDDIADVPDSICQEVLACEECGKNYKIQKPELVFYKKLVLPIPRNCSNCRHLARVKQRNPQVLFDRKCDKCGVDIQTTFAPDRPEKIYCEKCYLEVVD